MFSWMKGDKGFPGPQGPAGPAGRDGKDGLSEEAIRKIIADEFARQRATAESVIDYTVTSLSTQDVERIVREVMKSDLKALSFRLSAKK